MPATTGPTGPRHRWRPVQRQAARLQDRARLEGPSARASTSGNATVVRSRWRTTTPPVSGYDAPTRCHATSSAAWSKWRRVVSEKAPMAVAAMQDASRTAPALPPPAARRMARTGTRSRRRAASRPSTRTGRGRRRTRISPAARPARAGTAAMSGSEARRRAHARDAARAAIAQDVRPRDGQDDDRPLEQQAPGRGPPERRRRPATGTARRGDRGRDDGQHDEQCRRQGDRERRDDRGPGWPVGRSSTATRTARAAAGRVRSRPSAAAEPMTWMVDAPRPRAVPGWAGAARRRAG